jgi:hypothetical protein
MNTDKAYEVDEKPYVPVVIPSGNVILQFEGTGREIYCVSESAEKVLFDALYKQKTG